MKPKVALVKDGFLPAGSENVRGRLSGAAIERCKELAAQGWDIDGYTVTKSNTSSEPVKVEKTKADPNAIYDIPEQSRPDTWTASADGQPVGMRTVCNQCHNSLTYCRCQHPMVWVDHRNMSVVSFKELG